MMGEEQKSIYIRVDGNEEITAKHVIRCLIIAEQIRKLGIEVTFILADNRPQPLIEEKGFKADVLGTVWNDLDTETEILCSYLDANEGRVLLLDSYYVTKDYLNRLSKYTLVIYIDHICRFAYPVHALINYAVFTDPRFYPSVYNDEDQHPYPDFMVGGRYIPLKEEYHKVSFDIKPVVNKVLIITGGIDKFNMAEALLEEAMKDEELSWLTYHVIVRKFNDNEKMLRKLADKYPGHIFLHKNVKNIPEKVKECDVAVSTGGTILYELCACGIPTVCYENTNNHKEAELWQKNGYMLYAGNVTEDKSDCVQRCINALRWFRYHYDAREEMSRGMRKLVDGRGAIHIAEYLNKVLEKCKEEYMW